MSYLFTDFEQKDRIPYLEGEITRLQELCRNNFGTIDELRKENRKLTEVQMELKDTTTDLAYSLAECPWWDEQYTPMAFKILTSFTKNVQYILQLPTFIDPMEQLERYGLDRRRAIRFLKRHKKRLFSKGAPRVFKCQKCKKRFQSEARFRTHLNLHIHEIRKKLHCRQCKENFSKFVDYKAHLKTNAHLDSKIVKNYSGKTRDVLDNSAIIIVEPMESENSAKVVEIDLTDETTISSDSAQNELKLPIVLDKFRPHLQISVDSAFPKETFTLFDDVVCTFKNNIS